MILKINENKTIGELQDKFNECFPHLQIAFFKGEHALKTNQPLQRSVKISSISKKHRNEDLEIKSWDKEEKIIHDFKTELGLYVELFSLQDSKPVPIDKEETLCQKTFLFSPSHIAADVDADLDEEEIRLSI